MLKLWQKEQKKVKEVREVKVKPLTADLIQDLKANEKGGLFSVDLPLCNEVVN